MMSSSGNNESTETVNKNQVQATVSDDVTDAADSSTLVEVHACGICYSRYDTGKKIPKVLPCGHTYCLVCISSIARNGRRKLNCPSCRTPSKVSLRTLPNNFQLTDLLSKLKLIDESPPTAESIGERDQLLAQVIGQLNDSDDSDSEDFLSEADIGELLDVGATIQRAKRLKMQLDCVESHIFLPGDEADLQEFKTNSRKITQIIDKLKSLKDQFITMRHALGETRIDGREMTRSIVQRNRASLQLPEEQLNRFIGGRLTGAVESLANFNPRAEYMDLLNAFRDAVVSAEDVLPPFHGADHDLDLHRFRFHFDESGNDTDGSDDEFGRFGDDYNNPWDLPSEDDWEGEDLEEIAYLANIYGPEAAASEAAAQTGVLQQVNGRWRCTVCDCYVPSDNRGKLTHIMGRRHTAASDAQGLNRSATPDPALPAVEIFSPAQRNNRARRPPNNTARSRSRYPNVDAGGEGSQQRFTSGRGRRGTGQGAAAPSNSGVRFSGVRGRNANAPSGSGGHRSVSSTRATNGSAAFYRDRDDGDRNRGGESSTWRSSSRFNDPSSDYNPYSYHSPAPANGSAYGWGSAAAVPRYGGDDFFAHSDFYGGWGQAPGDGNWPRDPSNIYNNVYGGRGTGNRGASGGGRARGNARGGRGFPGNSSAQNVPRSIRPNWPNGHPDPGLW